MRNWRKHFLSTVTYSAACFALLQPAQATLIALWDLNDGSGSAVVDSVGRYNGTLVNFDDTSAGAGDTGADGWTSNGRIKFSGADATPTRVETLFPSSLLQNSDFTIEFMMSHNDPNGNWSPAIGQSGGCCIFIGKRTGSPILHANLNGLGSIDSGPLAKYGDGKLHHAALTFDNTANLLTLYFDELPVASSGDITGMLNNRGSLWFGNDGHAQTTEVHNGTIGAVAISNVALTPGNFVLIPEPSSVSLILIGLVGIYQFCRGLRRAD